MSSDDFLKRIQDALMKFVAVSGDGMSDNAAFLADIMSIVQDIQESDIIPTEEFEKQIAQLIELQALQESSTAALADGDFAALETITKNVGLLSGVDQTWHEDEPEIFEAIEDGNGARVKRALKEWDINQTHGKYEKTALYAAMSNMFGVSLDIVDTLLDAGANPQIGLSDCNVLHGLGFGRFTDVTAQAVADAIKRCVNLGAGLEQRSNKLQWTPLHTALTEWNVIASEALLIAGADPNARAGSENQACTAGQSCLAMSISCPEIFAILLDYGADPYEPDANGRTAFSEITQLLRDTPSEDFRADVLRCQDALQKHGKPQ